MRVKVAICFIIIFLKMPIHGEEAVLLIDHTCTKASRIPLYWIEQIKQRNMLLQCVGLSHSRQYRNGLILLGQIDPRFHVQLSVDLKELNEPNSLRVLISQYINGSWASALVDDDKYWSSESGRQTTIQSIEQAIRQKDPVAVSIWCWCWDICRPEDFYTQSEDFTEDDILMYLSALQSFNDDQDFIETDFLFQTSVTDCSAYLNVDGPWRVTYFNDYIRDYVRQHGGILLDQADIENWNISNTEQYMTTDSSNRTVYLRHSDYNESNGPDTLDGDHANDALCIRKASALWWLTARIAGWNGCPAIVGDVNGDCQVNIEDCMVMTQTWLEESTIPTWNPVCDISPDGGDGRVDSMDFNLLCRNWLEKSCAETNVADFDGNCSVSIEDLAILSGAWLSDPDSNAWIPACDLYPDNQTNFVDFQVFSENWGQDEFSTSN